MIFSLVGFFIVVILIDIRHLLNSNNRMKTGILYFTLMTMSFVLSLLLVMGRAPTSPAIIIEKIVKTVLG